MRITDNIDKLPGIYTFTNKLNGKKYVGKAVDMKDRISFYHRPKQKRPFESALRKYGMDNFSLHIDYFPKATNEELLKLEKIFIIQSNSLVSGHGYNVLMEGRDWTGVKRSKESIEKSALARTGQKRTPEQRRYMSSKSALRGKPSWNKGIECREETKRKLHLANVGREPPNKGIPTSEEQKRKNALCPRVIHKGADHSSSRKVIQLTKDGEFVNEFDSMATAYRETSILQSKICNVCKGKRKSAGGYVWKYLN